MNMDPANGNGSVPMQVADATVRSNASSSYVMTNNMTTAMPKQDEKIKAYVDFTEFNKNYEDFLKKKKQAEQSTNTSNINSEGKSSSSEDWEIVEP